ncbi:sugar transferase [Spirosoma fluminis]
MNTARTGTTGPVRVRTNFSVDFSAAGIADATSPNPVTDELSFAQHCPRSAHQLSIRISEQLVMAYMNLPLSDQLVRSAVYNDYVDYEPAVDKLPDLLLNYAPATTWEAVDLDTILNNDRALSGKHIFLQTSVTQLGDPNLVFGRVRSRLAEHQYFAVNLVTAENVKSSLNHRFNASFFNLYYPIYFLLKRVLPKLKGVRRLCKRLNIVPDVSKAEILGRLIFKGLKVIDIREKTHETTLIVKHNLSNDPSQESAVPSEGFMLKMKRLGQYAKPIYVYKLRTMHPYAEYVQAYLHETNGLDRGGKFKDDFRVITGGRVIRKYWIDEIPMLYNLLRGDVKLIGIRPLTDHYFSLYPASAQAVRIKHKPGLLPPFYADLPETFDEIVQSELTYLAAYEAAPLATDLRYLMRILTNILFRKARSK